MLNLPGKDRLIVALDVPTADEAMEAVKVLDNVSFFKIGWQLFMTGQAFQIIEKLTLKNVFVDLKVPGDIGNTIRSIVEQCTKLNVKFLTLSESVPLPVIQAARSARGTKTEPKLLTVPFLSSLDKTDLKSMFGFDTLDEYIISRAENAVRAGCDGVIASGDAIRLCREKLDPGILVVSPGIRPAGASTDDHKRHTTPTQAIALGADYLVVGRPILKSPDPRGAAEKIIAEIDAALAARDAPVRLSSQGTPEGSTYPLVARGNF